MTTLQSYFDGANFFRLWKSQLALFTGLCLFMQLAAQQANWFIGALVALPFIFIATQSATRHYLEVRATDAKFLAEIFFVGLVVRLIVVFLFSYLLQTFNPDGLAFVSTHDDYKYQQTMTQIYDYWEEYGIGSSVTSDIQFSSGQYAGFPYFGVFMMLIFGQNIYAARIGNAILSALTLIVINRLCSCFMSRDRAIFTTCLFAFAPPVIIYSACTFKDTLLLFLFTVNLLCVVRLYLKKRWRNLSIAFLLISSSGMIFCRPALIFLCFSSYLLFSGYQMILKKKPSFMIFLNVAAFIVVVLVWNYFYRQGWTTEYVDFIDANIAARERLVSETRAGVSQYSFAKLLGAPIFVAFSPFLPPYSMLDFNKEESINYDFLIGFFYFTLLPFVIVGIFEAIRRRKTEPVPFLLLIVALVYKVAQAKSTLSVFSIRQSLPATAVLLLFAPYGWERLKHSRGLLLTVNVVSIALLAAYNFFRLLY